MIVGLLLLIFVSHRGNLVETVRIGRE